MTETVQEAPTTAAAMLADIAEADSGPPVSKAVVVFWKLMVLMLSVGLILWLQMGFVFTLIGMLPSIIAYFTDTSNRKNFFKGIFSCNVAGVLPYLATAAHPGAGAASIELAMMESSTWMMVYGAATLGWMIVWICRLVAYMMLTLTYQSKIGMLEREQQKLLAEWGPQLKRRAV